MCICDTREIIVLESTVCIILPSRSDCTTLYFRFSSEYLTHIGGEKEVIIAMYSTRAAFQKMTDTAIQAAILGFFSSCLTLFVILHSVY